MNTKKVELKNYEVEAYYLQALKAESLLRVIEDSMNYVSDTEEHIKISTNILSDVIHKLTEDLKNLVDKTETEGAA